MCVTIIVSHILFSKRSDPPLCNIGTLLIMKTKNSLYSRHYVFISIILIFILNACDRDITPADDKQFNPDYIFDIKSLPTITIEIDQNDWDKYLKQIDDNINTRTYIPATFVFNKNEQIFTRKNIGFRMRGNHSRMRPEGTIGNPHTPNQTEWHPVNYQIRFTQHEDGHRFFGCDRIILRSFQWDYMYCREVYCYDLFRRFGVWTAPKSSYCRLYIHVSNDSASTYFGIYNMVEGIRKEYLEQRQREGHIKSDKGNLWHITPTTDGANLYNADYPENIGIDTDTETYLYSLRTNQEEGFENAKNELMTFATELKSFSQGSDELRQWLEEHVDVDLFLRYLAVDVAVGSWDDYWCNGNNYMFYFDTNHKFHIIPFDYENTLGRSGIIDAGTHSVLDWGRFNPILATQTLSIPEYFDTYKKYLRELVDDKRYLDYEASQMRISDWHNMISPYLNNDLVDGEGQLDYLLDKTMHSDPNYYQLFSSDSTTNFFLVKKKSIYLDCP